MIWKIQKKIVKRYEKYGRKVGWNVKWYGRKVSWNVKWYGKKVSWKVKRYGKYGKKASWIVKWYWKYGTSNYKSDRPYVNIWGQLKDFEISKYKRESKWRMPIRIFVLFLLIVVLYVFLNIKSVEI